jgi:beta-xylosidase
MSSRRFRYTNPITLDPAQSLRDHCIVKVGEHWYMTGTSHPVWEGPNPGVRLLRSQDLIHWSDAGWLIEASKLPEGCPYNGRFWAPEIHQAHGRFWLTVNSGHEGPEHPGRRMDDHHVWLFVSEEVIGPYRLVTPDGLGAGFKNDATLFTDEDGRSYMYCSGGGLWQAAMDLGAGRLLTRDGDFEKILDPRDPGNPDWMIGGIEGPFVIKREGAYWMFFSAWTRGYEIGVLRAEAPLGPWTLIQRNPIFGTRKRAYRAPQAREGGFDHLLYEDTPDPFAEVGHNAVFAGPDGRDWLCCHDLLQGDEVLATEPVIRYSDTQEQLHIEPLEFRQGRWRVRGPSWTEQVVEW